MTPEQAAHEYALSKTQGTEIGFPTHDRLYNAFLAGHAHAQNRWVKVGDEPIKEYVNVLFLTENDEIFHGFVNTYGDIMEGQQGRFATKHKRDVENDITHYRYITLPQPPEHG